MSPSALTSSHAAQMMNKATAGTKPFCRDLTYLESPAAQHEHKNTEQSGAEMDGSEGRHTQLAR